jgi:sec-independent protein translocase protein TatB
VFEVGFTELLLIFALALIVLGPERLPRLASQVGRWIGRARAMARQFREQLEDEARLDDMLKPDPPGRTKKPSSAAAQPEAAASPDATPPAPPANFVPPDDDFRHNDIPEPPDEPRGT